jgi:uncharacterized oxidoreductase
MQISGNTILITGGATGIGLELARAMLERGNDVVICGRRAERLEEAKRRLPALHVRVADVASAESRAELVRWIEAAHPRTNVLVNNAGVQHRVDLGDVENLKLADEEIAINLLAPIHLTAMLLPQLQRQRSAAIVNVSSGLAFAPLARMPVYCATKAALHSLTLSLRHQLRDSNVRVVEVIPPLVRSELGAWHRPPQLNEMAMPAEAAVAELVAGLERDDVEIAIGGAAEMVAKREALFDMLNARG